MLVGLYAWAFFGADHSGVTEVLFVSKTAVVLAVTTVIGSLAVYIWSPKTSSMLPPSVIPYLLLTATLVILILDTGGTTSPFIALWMLIAVFAGIFGLYGIVPLFLTTVVYLYVLFDMGALTRGDIITIALVGELPLIVSYLVWHHKSTYASHAIGGEAYRELASELSQVAGKAEVVINAIADGVIALDHKGIVELINPAAQQIIGWGKKDAIGLDYKSVLQLTDKDDNELEPSIDPVAVTIATNKEIQRDDLTLLTVSGKKLMISVVISPVGKIGSGVIVVFRDITNQKTEERAQAEFISTASHEMRTPVASIEGYLGLALNPATATIDLKARDFIEKAHESAEHLGRLFQDLLDVTRADDGRLSNHPKVIDVVDFINVVVQGLESKAKEKGLHMIFKPMPSGESTLRGRRLSPMYYVNVDPDHLREVISNLVENAIKYTPRGDVAIDVAGDAQHVIVSVADSGMGIPGEDIPHLFQKFYRVDNSQTREIGGTGLGLYLCRRLAEGMNGRVWVESQFEQGSTFYIELPRLDHEEATRMIESAALTPMDELIIPDKKITRTDSAPVLVNNGLGANVAPVASVSTGGSVPTVPVAQTGSAGPRPALFTPTTMPAASVHAAAQPVATAGLSPHSLHLHVDERGPRIKIPVREPEPPIKP